MMNNESDYKYTPSQLAWIERRKQRGSYVAHYISSSSELVVVNFYSGTGYTFRVVGRRGGSELMQTLSPRSYRQLYKDELPTHPRDIEQEA